MRKIFKRIGAMVVAAALAVATMGLAVSAADGLNTWTGDDFTAKYKPDAESDLTADEAATVAKVKITVDLTAGDYAKLGGGYNSNGAWTAFSDIDSTGLIGEINTIGTKEFTVSVTSLDKGSLEIQCWWMNPGSSATLTKVEYLKADGTVVKSFGGSAPESGDASHIALYLLAAVAAAGVVVCATRRKAAVER